MNITRSTPYRLGLFYFLFFAWMGIQIPYFNLYLYHKGLSPAEIGAITAAFPLVRVFAPTFWGYLTDRFDKKGRVGPLLWLFSTLIFSLLFFTDRFIPILLIVSLFTFFWAPTLPLVEAAAMMVVGKTGIDYGRMRVWGTAGFILIAWLTGRLLDHWPMSVILSGMFLFLILNALLAWRLPSKKGGEEHLAIGQVVEQIRRPEVFRFLTVVMLMLVSHSAYYGFFSIYLESLGYAKGTIGFLWALGPLGEVIVLLNSRVLLKRYGARSLLSFALLMAALRWTLFGVTDQFAFILIGQFLHTFTFGAFHIASVRLVGDLFPEGMNNTAQALYSSSAYGTGLVIGSLACGLLYEQIGAPMLFFMSGAAALLAFYILRRSTDKDKGNGTRITRI